MANRVSVTAGVSETIRCGSDLSTTWLCSSSVSVIGKVGLGLGLATGLGFGAMLADVEPPGAAVTAGFAVGPGVTPDEAPVQAPRTSAAAAARAPIRASVRRRRTRGPWPRMGGATDGFTWMPTLSLEGSSTNQRVGDRTRAVTPGWSAATTVAGLCRDLTGFATQRSGDEVGPGSVADEPLNRR